MDQRRISRRAFGMAAALGAASLVAPAARAQPRPDKTQVTIGVDDKAAMAYLPLTIAEQLGFFKAEGLEVEVLEVAPGGRATDVTCGSFERALALHARGAPMQAFVLQGRAPAVALGFSAKAWPPLHGAADLRGRRIGVPALGGAGHLVASAALMRAGVHPNDVTFVPVGGAPLAPQALRVGQVDAVCVPEPSMTMLEQRAEVRILNDTRTLKGTQALFGGSMPSACLFAPQEFVQKHPGTCQALTHAMVHALKWLQTAGPRDILGTVPEPYLMGDRALYLAAFERLRESISPDGLIADEGARTALRALAAFDPAVRIGRVIVARTYTNEFTRRAKEKFNA